MQAFVWKTIRGVLAVLAVSSVGVSAEIVTFDLADDFVTPLTNGQIVESPAAFGAVFNITSSGSNLGAAIFNSDPAGPNAASADIDLLVGMSNVLILQESDLPGQSTPGFFDSPNDDRNGGTLNFDFSPANFAVGLNSIDVIDVDNGNSMMFTLTDSAGRIRTVDVPFNFTGDMSDGDPGSATIDFAAGTQESPNVSGLFTLVLTEAGFNLGDIASLTVDIRGSGALDNLSYVPEPTTGLLVAMAAFGLVRRKRR
jgi:PEP-CTERM motif